MAFSPTDRALRLTKETAAARQVLLAISALEAGHYDAAITLAGAAEGMLAGDPDIEISTQLLAHPSGKNVEAPYTWPEIVNLERNWLKHKTADGKAPHELTLDLDNTPFYVFRAMRKLPVDRITSEMLAFETWYRARLDR